MFVILGRSGEVCGDFLKYLQARNLRSIYVHVVDFWQLNVVQVLFLSHFLLKHFGLLLVLLDTVVDTMNQDVSVDDLLLSESVRSLLVAETSGPSRRGNCRL